VAKVSTFALAEGAALAGVASAVFAADEAASVVLCDDFSQDTSKAKVVIITGSIFIIF
jgi:hypothetical protein